MSPDSHIGSLGTGAARGLARDAGPAGAFRVLGGMLALLRYAPDSETGGVVFMALMLAAALAALAAADKGLWGSR